MLTLKMTKFIKDAKDKVEHELRNVVSSNIDLINELILGTINNGGKRVRPLFHILIAGMCGYTGKNTIKVATILEYLHTASLLHDDVIDGATVRRGHKSANIQYGNNITVLSGDYLYTCAFIEALRLPGKGFTNILTAAALAMSEGEILQMQKTGDTSLTMDEYKRIIYGKTAALFAAGSECAALLGNVDSKAYEALKNFGCNIGYVFQMKDDLLDYFGSEKVIGKKPGTDLDEKKVTLPVILYLNETDGIGRKEFEQLFTSNVSTCEKLDVILPLFNKYNIHEKAANIIKSYTDIAISNLFHFPDSEYKTALLSLTDSLNYRIS